MLDKPYTGLYPLKSFGNKVRGRGGGCLGGLILLDIMAVVFVKKHVKPLDYLLNVYFSWM